MVWLKLGNGQSSDSQWNRDNQLLSVKITVEGMSRTDGHHRLSCQVLPFDSMPGMFRLPYVFFHDWEGLFENPESIFSA